MMDIPSPPELLEIAAIARTEPGLPRHWTRQEEDALLDLCTSGNVDPEHWRSAGSPFFLGGVAVLLASARGFDRRTYLALGEALYRGISFLEVFQVWMERTPVRAARFLPMARARMRIPC